MYRNILGFVGYIFIIGYFYFKITIEVIKRNRFIVAIKTKILKLVRSVGYVKQGKTYSRMKKVNFLLKKINFRAILYARKYNLFLYTRISDLLKSKKHDLDVQLLRTIKSYPYGKKRYKKFDLVGNNVKIHLRGGDLMYSNDVHTLLINNASISGAVQGVMHKRRLVSIIETPGISEDFGCFNNRTIKFVTRNLALIFKAFKTSRQKVIFFGANRGYSGNYFHFMLDALPSLLCTMQTLRKRPDWQDFIVLIPEDIHANVREILYKCCDYFGYKYKSFGILEWIDCKQVAFTGYPTYMKNPLPVDVNYSVSPVLTRFTRNILHKIFPVNENKNFKFLYSTREDAKNTSTSRHVINYQEVSDNLKELNFITLNPAKMDLASQVKNFSVTEVIVLDGGAAIANLLFSRRCKHAIVLAMSEGTDPSLFVSFAQSLGIEIAYVCGKAKPVSFVPSWHLSYEIDVYLLKEYVYKLLHSA